MTILLILLLLQIKHLVIDWIWQPPYEYENKGTWLHPGGIQHSGKQAIGDYLVFMWFFSTPIAITLSIIEFIIHYGTDYAKVNINKAKGWGPTTHHEFWWLTGADQFVHQVTFIGLIALGLFLT